MKHGEMVSFAEEANYNYSGRFLICINKSDQKVFAVKLDDPFTFPENNGAILSLIDRNNLTCGDPINLYLPLNYLDRSQLVSTTFVSYAHTKKHADQLVDLISQNVSNCNGSSSSYQNSDQVPNGEALQNNQIKTYSKVQTQSDEYRQLKKMIDDRFTKFEAKLDQKINLVIGNVKQLFDNIQMPMEEKVEMSTSNVIFTNDIDIGLEEDQNETIRFDDSTLKRKSLNHRRISVDKVYFLPLALKDCLYSEHDPIPLWTESSSLNMKENVNKCYLYHGSDPAKFFHQLAREMYGDLLVFYKMQPHKLASSKESLYNFDPTGHAVLLDVISKYYHEHEHEIFECSTQEKMTFEDFENVIFRVIDKWGRKAFCKRGRSRPIIDCLLFNMLKEEFKLRSDSNKQEYEMILQEYDLCRVVKKLQFFTKRPCYQTSLEEETSTLK